MGYKINTIENGKLVCPCHEPQFNLDGSPAKGPAVEPLHKIDYRMQEGGARMKIYHRI